MDREEILVRLRERIVAFAASRIAGDIAEDLAQEVLMLLHEKYAHVERLEELLPLSLQILRFKMMAVYRKASRRGERGGISVDDLQVPDLGPDPAAYLERKEMVERLRRAMSGLCERCRRLMRLKLEGKSLRKSRNIWGRARSIRCTPGTSAAAKSCWICLGEAGRAASEAQRHP